MKNRTLFYIIAIIILVLIGVVIWKVKSIQNNQNQPNPTPTQSPTVLNSVTYACNAGKSITATFQDGPSQPPASPGMPPTPGGSADVKLSDSRELNLHQTISADGVRYANQDESFVFWSKGNGALVLENNQSKSYIGCVLVRPQPQNSDLTQIYQNSSLGISMRLPANVTPDEKYTYILIPNKKISGVKIPVPPTFVTGTNLSSDSYLSIESIPNTKSCSATLFLNNSSKSLKAIEQDEFGTTYSVASTTGAAAGNRYEETVFALPNTNPCIAVRYFIHYGVFENYPAGTVKQFDEQALKQEFDLIRSTIVISQ